MTTVAHSAPPPVTLCPYCHDTGYYMGVRVNGECNYCTSAERRERQVIVLIGQQPS